MKSKCLRVGGLEEKIERMGSQRITVSDHMNTADNKTDNFVIAMDSFAPKDHEAPANSRIVRSLSRKWSHQSSNVIQNGNANEKRNENDPLLPSFSPKDNYLQGQSVVTTTEKSIVGTTMDQHCSNHQQTAHHQITITTINTGESRYARRNSFRRSSSSSWILDPKRILFIFATLSSIGTILLIYFTLSMRGTVVDLEQ